MKKYREEKICKTEKNKKFGLKLETIASSQINKRKYEINVKELGEKNSTHQSSRSVYLGTRNN